MPSRVCPVIVCLLLSLSFAVTGTQADKEKEDAKENFHLYLLIGQSNMAGRGTVGEEDRTAHPRVLALNKEGKWVPARDPIHFDKSAAGVSLGTTFGKEMAEHNTSVTIGLVPCAVGGSPIAAWKPGAYYSGTKTYPWDDTVKRAHIAMQKGVFKGVLWHQGESDSNPVKIAVYEEELRDLIARVRKELNAPELPFIMGELGVFFTARNPNGKVINDIMAKVAGNMPNVAVVSSQGLWHGGDRTHFSTAALHGIGRRYAQALDSESQVATLSKLLESVAKKNSKVDVASIAKTFAPPRVTDQDAYTLLMRDGIAGSLQDPHESQKAHFVADLQSNDARVQSAAAEAIGFLRAYGGAEALAVALLGADAAAVRRNAAISLAWCGGREQIPVLIKALGDADWTVRGASATALENLTAHVVEFDSLASEKTRTAQAAEWQTWWAHLAPDAVPSEAVALLKTEEDNKNPNLALNCAVKVSSLYKGPAAALTDGALHGGFWQTKNVAFPQSCTIDLGAPIEISHVRVFHYGADFVPTESAVEVSADGMAWQIAAVHKGDTPVTQDFSFTLTKARFVRIISENTVNPVYPNTSYEVEVYRSPPPAKEVAALVAERMKRGVCALGAMGGTGATEMIVRALNPTRKTMHNYTKTPKGTVSGLGFEEKAFVQTALRSLGRLHAPEGLETLIAFLQNPQWARYAAEALGEFGGEEAEAALLQAYPTYARHFGKAMPTSMPQDDHPGLTPEDRMFETPFAVASALSRMPFKNAEHLKELREIAPLLMENLPSDFDGAMLYQPEGHHRVTAWLMEQAGLRGAARNAAMLALGVEIEVADTEQTNRFLASAKRRAGEVMCAAWWLPTVCDRTDVERLEELLQARDGWVSINATKALIFMKERSAVEKIQPLIYTDVDIVDITGGASKQNKPEQLMPEAAYGFNTDFFFGDSKVAGHDEYNCPQPRRREAWIRALGKLSEWDNLNQADVLVRALGDADNSPGIRYAAAQALGDINGPAPFMRHLYKGEEPFASIALLEKEFFWRHDANISDFESIKNHYTSPEEIPAVKIPPVGLFTAGIAFIKGAQNMPNDFQIDPWRQTYSTTDSGPTYRPGDNIFLLQPSTTGAKNVKQITFFEGGAVADLEVSWDGKRLLFARHEAKSPWWHVFEIDLEKSEMQQLTVGYYHDVQPNYLPDGRIVFSTSRMGYRDEYHGYLATGLAVMDPDGSDIRYIGFNLGRDNEPAVMDDGQILFSRLELFYARLKTELTLQTMFPDGSRNVTLYGPERREYWRQVTVKSGEKGWGEVPPRHRVLRLTQPQSFGPGQVLCASTAGLIVVGPGRVNEHQIPHPQDMAVTTPFPMPDGRILCAATKKVVPDKSWGNFPVGTPDLGLYWMDPDTGKMTLLYNDPETADYEARPLIPRKIPPRLAEGGHATNESYTGHIYCQSVFNTRDERVARLGKFVRVVEGQPLVTRHYSHINSTGEAWKNHAGTHARVLGTAPLAVDGSFYLEVPADRLVQLQVLDSDRRVVGNQLIWMYTRPGETRSCVGCHEKSDTTQPAVRRNFPQAAGQKPVECLPTGGEFSYRAKFWNKGTLTDEGEERTRTVRAVNLLGKY